MAEQAIINTFSGGLNQDVDFILQPDGTYRNMKNGMLISMDGHSYTVEISQGNNVINTLPAIFKEYDPRNSNITFDKEPMPIGFISFPDKLIVFSTNDNSSTGGYGEIGQVYLTNIGQSVEAGDVSLDYGSTAYVWSGYVPLYRHESLNFSQMYKIEGFGFKENDAIERIYWTDNYNQPRVFDIADSTFSTYFTSTAGVGDNPLVSGDEYMVLNGIIEHRVASGTF